jgi:hypothetical protein
MQSYSDEFKLPEKWYLKAAEDSKDLLDSKEQSVLRASIS